MTRLLEGKIIGHRTCSGNEAGRRPLTCRIRFSSTTGHTLYKVCRFSSVYFEFEIIRVSSAPYSTCWADRNNSSSARSSSSLVNGDPSKTLRKKKRYPNAVVRTSRRQELKRAGSGANPKDGGATDTAITGSSSSSAGESSFSSGTGHASSLL